MTRLELVDAYISRAINRRTFVRGLIALGISAGVAASYAVALQPAAARSHDYYDYYDAHGEPKPSSPAATPGSSTSAAKAAAVIAQMP